MIKGKINFTARPQVVYIDARDYVEIRKDSYIEFFEKLSQYKYTENIASSFLYFMYKKRLYIKISSLIRLADQLGKFNIKLVFIGEEKSYLDMYAADMIRSLSFIDVLHMPMSEILSSVNSKFAFTLISKTHNSTEKGFMHPEDVLWKTKVY